MSTRYMWNRYDVGSAAAIQQTAAMNSQILYGLYDTFNVLFAVTGIEFKAEGCVITSGYQTTIVGAGQYFMFMSGGYFSSPPTLPLTIPIGTNTQLKQAVTNCAITVEQQYDGMSTTGWFVTSSGTYADMSITSSKTLNGPVSSGMSGTYPQNGMSGSYWYEYQGQDTIDPTGVDYVSAYAYRRRAPGWVPSSGSFQRRPVVRPPSPATAGRQIFYANFSIFLLTQR